MVKLEWKDKQGIDPVTLCFAFAAMNAHLVQLDGEQYSGIVTGKQIGRAHV